MRAKDSFTLNLISPVISGFDIFRIFIYPQRYPQITPFYELKCSSRITPSKMFIQIKFTSLKTKNAFATFNPRLTYFLASYQRKKMINNYPITDYLSISFSIIFSAPISGIILISTSSISSDFALVINFTLRSFHDKV